MGRSDIFRALAIVALIGVFMATLAVRGGAAALAGGAAAARGAAFSAGAASSAYSLGSAGQSGAAGVAAGLGGVGRAAGSAATSPVRRVVSRAAGGLKESYQSGAQSVSGSADGSTASGAAATGSTNTSSPPAWAQRMKRGASATADAVKSGDSRGGGHSVDLSERE